MAAAPVVLRPLAAARPEPWRLYQPAQLRGDCPEPWLAGRKRVMVEGNEFAELDLGASDDPVVVLAHSHLFHVRQSVYHEAATVQRATAERLLKEEALSPLRAEWQSQLKVMRGKAQRHAEIEYNRMSRYKLRCEELQPGKDVFPHDYLWLQHALRCKYGILDAVAAQYFPLEEVVRGVRLLAEQLLHIRDAPGDPDWYARLCPWQKYNATVRGYPRCLTPPQAWEIFRAAGFELSAGLLPEGERNPAAAADSAAHVPLVYARLFERIAQNADFTARYTNHWSRAELLPSAARQPLPMQYAKLLARTANLFPAYELEQGWWYSRVDLLAADPADQGLQFYCVPDPRRLVRGGVYSYRELCSSLIADLLYKAMVTAQRTDEGPDAAVFGRMHTAVEALGPSAESDTALERAIEQLPDLLETEDVTEHEPPFPNVWYNETYRPILASEIQHADRNHLQLPQWYKRRRDELVAQFKKECQDLAPHVDDMKTDLDFDTPKEEEKTKAGAAAEAAETEEQDEDGEADAVDNVNLPIAERLRQGRLEAAMRVGDDNLTRNILKDSAVAGEFENAEAMEKRQRENAARRESAARIASGA
eukprot:TRINITY_DN56091_c0_g1_i1.p1 TRINITY_DN56091_c0_g1~~TRINITY_DN56091_c0_g1_i1.p1  ORF type:complete len:619 (+),score=203.71 TRINITY_DN56091_c0_g1_i1:84-1859(+)